MDNCARPRKFIVIPSLATVKKPSYSEGGNSDTSIRIVKAGGDIQKPPTRW
jgi:hypothetical protein